MDSLLKKTLYTTGIIIAVYVFMYYFVDIPVAKWAYTYKDSVILSISSMISLLADSEIWQPMLLLTLAGIYLYEYKYGRKTWTVNIAYLILSIIVAIVVAGALKFLLGRPRPLLFHQEAKYSFQFLATTWEMHSTPSGHTARIFAFMAGLAMLFPRFRWGFFALGLLVGISRVFVNHHYPSDVMLGAYIGVMAAIYTSRVFFHEKSIGENTAMYTRG